jgi:hypothetical protein
MKRSDICSIALPQAVVFASFLHIIQSEALAYKTNAIYDFVVYDGTANHSTANH